MKTHKRAYNIQGVLFAAIFLVLACREVLCQEHSVVYNPTFQIKAEDVLYLGRTWNIEKTYGKESTPGKSLIATETTEKTNRKIAPSYYIYSGPITSNADEMTKISYGAALNFKYYAGIDYDYLKANLPGKTISFDVFVPAESVSRSDIRPSRLRVSLKSENGVWAEYTGEKEWTKVTAEGKYSFRIKIPDKPVLGRDGKTFHPENIVLLSIEHYMVEGKKCNENLSFYFSNFNIEGINLDPSRLTWQAMENGYTLKDMFISTMPEGSTIIKSMQRGINLNYDIKEEELIRQTFGASKEKNMFVTTAVTIPEELRGMKGILIMKIKNSGGPAVVSIKTFHECGSDGKIYFTFPVYGLASENGDKNGSGISLELKIRTNRPHTASMRPIVIDPLKIQKGYLVSFCPRCKEPKGFSLGTERPGKAGETPTPKTMAAPEVSSGVAGTEINPSKNWIIRKFKDNEKFEDSLLSSLFAGGSVRIAGINGWYQMFATVRLKGGIDWKKNDHYRVEFIRNFDSGEENLENYHLEVLIDPITNLVEYWQKPARARIALIDVNGKRMFGPNVSFCEGLPVRAYLDVSSTSPIPKGFTMDGFDASRVKAVIINIEASPQEMAAQDITLSFNNFSICRKNDIDQTFVPKEPDFTGFKKDTDAWILKDIIKRSGGYAVGINYPFPVIKVPKDMFEVPQVYPLVGMKATDPMRVGCSTEITRNTMIRDFKKMLSNNINIVRIFTLGHLEGVFTWDEMGKNIAAFDDTPGFKKAASGGVEEFTEFLNENEKEIFKKDKEGKIPGLERHVTEDFTALLDILEKVERGTGKKMAAVISLYDFLLGDGIKAEGPRRKYIVGEHPEVVLDPYTKRKAQALVWKIMKDLARDGRFYKYIAAVEIMNEPENANVLAEKSTFPLLVDFVGEGLYMLKDAIGPKTPATVGFRCWYKDLQYWTNVRNGIDILAPHYWESLESCDINVPGIWPLSLPSDEIWKTIGAEKGDRLTGIGEISPRGDIKANLRDIENAGYDFALVWSYSGHDSHDAKKVLNLIRDYQEANFKTAKLKKDYPGKCLKLSFGWLTRERLEADALRKAEKITGEPAEKDFRAMVRKKAEALNGGSIRSAILGVIEIAELKNIELNFKNIQDLRVSFVGREAAVVKKPVKTEKPPEQPVKFEIIKPFEMAGAKVINYSETVISKAKTAIKYQIPKFVFRNKE
ncbi:MAG: hypothetical protein HQL28_03590 [Candidatus Omnitrophica bacterium]|nr:hypothetical protein [Candidatus Omnitrophota bacterium]